MTPRALAGSSSAQTGDDTSSDKGTKLKEKPPGCHTIFIKNLPYDATEAEIRERFMVYGPIKSVRLAVWGHTGNMKGFGYVDYKREDSVEVAVKKSGEIVMKDRCIAVDYETGAPKKGYKGDKGSSHVKGTSHAHKM